MPSRAPPPRGARGPGWLYWVWRPALVLLVAVALAWWMLGGEWFRGRPREPAAPEPSVAAPTEVPPRVWRPRAVAKPAPGCQPEAERRCEDGDVWWLDSCGVVYAKAEDCEARLCRGGECEPPEVDDCGGEPIGGRCDGDVARGCEGGRAFKVDCAALERRCVLTEEGPACRPTSPDDCDPRTETPRCDGETLIACREGVRTRIDCRTYGALCGTPPAALVPTCVQLPAPVAVEGCEDPCGCPAQERGDEVCDGRDNDGDGYIDESGSCAAIDVVVYVVIDASGRGSYAREDIDTEIAELQRRFAREDDYGLEIRLAEVVRLAEPEWLELDEGELDAMLRDGTFPPRRDDFYVPIVLTERLIIDGVPRPGLSTVPNGTCGGQRRTAGPAAPLGLVALAKRHWPTTLAHELGHFLGLCHTHGDQPAPVVAIDPGPAGGLEGARACVEPCNIDDDGICDTPVDPGPDVCAVDLECNPICSDGSTPDPHNVMGYYPFCRQGFTEQQALLMRRSLALRRGWHACTAGEGCTCELGVGTCPEGMSCRLYVGDPSGRCVLDGPAAPGGVCARSEQCSLGSVCIGQPDADARCVRPCDDDTPGCRCVEVGGVGHPICIDDLRRDAGPG